MTAPRRLLRYGTALAALASAAVVAACGGASAPPGARAPASQPTASQPSGSQPSGSQAPGSQVSGTRVQVRMTEYHLAPAQQRIPAGTVTFVAVNAGTMVHALAISGPGVGGERTPGLVQPGGSANLTLTLEPGVYELYCPVDGHKSLGMDTDVTVVPAGGSGGQTSR